MSETMRQPRGNGVRRQAGGFTLIELLVTIAVLAIVLAIALPSFRGVVNGNRITAATNEFVGILQVAKMEAIRRNGRVTVCPTTNGTGCGGSNWQRSLVLAADGTALQQLRVDPAMVIRVSSNISGATPADNIVFRSDGLARRGSDSEILQGKIEVCMVTQRPTDNARWVSVAGARVSVDPPRTSTDCTAAVSNS